MSKYNDLSEQKFNHWTVIERIYNHKKKGVYYLCECDCDHKTRKIVNSTSLKSGDSKSCGCLASINQLSKSRLYRILSFMKQRCYNERSDEYKNYGARGIRICDEWLKPKEGFINFYNWAMVNGYDENLSIDRINVHGNYEPTNCKWTTDKEQSNNKTNNIFIEINGTVKTRSEWADELNINYSTLKARYEKGLIGDELIVPVNNRNVSKRQSGIKGITWNTAERKWRVRIGQTYIGAYKELDEAKAAHERASKMV